MIGLCLFMMLLFSNCSDENPVNSNSQNTENGNDNNDKEMARSGRFILEKTYKSTIKLKNNEIFIFSSIYSTINRLLDDGMFKRR